MDTSMLEFRKEKVAPIRFRNSQVFLFQGQAEEGDALLHEPLVS